jgi:hypothetical protein
MNVVCMFVYIHSHHSLECGQKKGRKNIFEMKEVL